MQIIEIKALDNGAHSNQTSDAITSPPLGWAVVPDEMEIPGTFPFVDIQVEGNKVVSMTAVVVPEPEPQPEPEPTETEQLRADVDFLAAMAGVTL